MTLLSFHFVLSNSDEYKVFNFYMEFTAYLSSQRVSSLRARISLPQKYADIDSDTVLSLIFLIKSVLRSYMGSEGTLQIIINIT